MRKEQKDSVIEFVQLLKTAQEHIRQLLMQQEYASVLDLLSQCQQGAIRIGTMIEEAEGEGFVTVKKLEDYCELMFQLHQMIQGVEDGANIDGDIVFGAIDRQLSEIGQSIQNDIKVRKEMVFLPYKAAMWDSLESIWLAADADPECDAYVIPIPYYDLNPDGSCREFHYEAEFMPQYVPIIRYDEYNFEKRRPDAIFIHNPFDHYNYVTRVHPFFFSSNLKQYTKNLIYVPYFVTGGYMSDSFEALPSYVHMDYIVTQSEKIEPFYNEMFRSKLIPLGSPKSDCVLKALKEEDIPVVWKEKIGGKKVFLYNTSITGILNHENAFLNKMRYVLECFRGREDVVLLWRPHPLLVATLKSIRIQLVEAYMEIANEFRQLPNVIFDDNPNDALAVKVADAYIGESTSSMVCLFGIQGKPIFLTNPEILSDSIYVSKNIYAYDSLMVNDEMWVLSGMDNYLYSIAEGVTKRYQIPEEYVDGVRLYNEIIRYENKLILVPYTAHEIAVFDLFDYSFTKIAYENYLDTRFVRGVVYDGAVYFVPSIGNYILKMDVSTYAVTYVEQPVADIQKECDATKPMFFNTVVQQGELLFAASSQVNKVLVMNMKTGQYTYEPVGDTGDTYWSMIYSEGAFWLASHEGCFFVKWNYETGEWKKIDEFPEGYQGETNCFIQLVGVGKEIYAFPKTGNAILKIHADTGQISICDMGLTYKEGQRSSSYYNWPSNYYFARKLDDQKICAMTAYNHSLQLIDIESKINKTEYIPLEISKEDYCKRFRREGPNIPLACKETRSATIKQFIDVVKDGFDLKEVEVGLYAEEINNMDGTCGEKIKDFVMRL